MGFLVRAYAFNVLLLASASEGAGCSGAGCCWQEKYSKVKGPIHRLCFPKVDCSDLQTWRLCSQVLRPARGWAQRRWLLLALERPKTTYMGQHDGFAFQKWLQ